MKYVGFLVPRHEVTAKASESDGNTAEQAFLRPVTGVSMLTCQNVAFKHPLPSSSALERRFLLWKTRCNSDSSLLPDELLVSESVE